MTIITVNKKDLVNALSFVKSMAIDKHFHYYFVWEPGKFIVGSTIGNLVHYEMKAECNSSGCVGYEDVRDLLKRKDAFRDKVTISVDGEKTEIDGIKCLSYIIDSKEYSTKQEKFINDIPDGFSTVTNLPVNKVSKAFEKCKLSQSLDTNRYFMTGTCFDKGRMVSTDGKRLSIINIGIDTSVDGKELQPIVPAEYMISVIKYGKGTDLHTSYGTIESYSNPFMYVNYGCVKGFIECRQGQFPNYERVVPEYRDDSDLSEGKINRKDMLSELKDVKPFVEKLQMRIFTRNGHICCNSGIGNYESNVRILPEGCPDIAFNWQYLLDAFSTQLEYDSVTMKWSNKYLIDLKENRKGTLKAITFSEPENIEIIMPMNFPEDELKTIVEENEYKTIGKEIYNQLEEQEK